MDTEPIIVEEQLLHELNKLTQDPVALGFLNKLILIRFNELTGKLKENALASLYSDAEITLLELDGKIIQAVEDPADYATASEVLKRTVETNAQIEAAYSKLRANNNLIQTAITTGYRARTKPTQENDDIAEILRQETHRTAINSLPSGMESNRSAIESLEGRIDDFLLQSVLDAEKLDAANKAAAIQDAFRPDKLPNTAPQPVRKP